jgi:hypothetical protein
MDKGSHGDFAEGADAILALASALAGRNRVGKEVPVQAWRTPARTGLLSRQE